MTTSSRPRPILFALALLALLVSCMSFAGVAHAGALHVRDEGRVLSSEDVNRLRSVVAAAPFDARFVVTSEYPDAQDLSRYVASLVAEPNMVAVGLDPQHHHVQVHFGTGSRVARSAWPAIERAGNDAFRKGDWAGGASAIFREAGAAVGGSGEAVPVAGGSPSLIGPGLLILIVVAAIGVAGYFAWKRSTAYGPPGRPGYGPPPYGGPGYPMGPPQGGGMGPLGGGLIGAGLGGLAGYELGRMEGEREGRGRDLGSNEGQGSGGGVDNDGGGNFDEGGGGSSWDDGGGGDFGGGGDGGGSDF
jgi:hypothetical protein